MNERPPPTKPTGATYHERFDMATEFGNRRTQTRLGIPVIALNLSRQQFQAV